MKEIKDFAVHARTQHYLNTCCLLKFTLAGPPFQPKEIVVLLESKFFYSL